MGTIKKTTLQDGSIRYKVECRVVGPDKRATTKRKTFRRHADAQRWERETDAQLRTRGAADTSRMTWADLIDAYLSHAQGLGSLAAGKTQRNRTAHLAWWRDRVGRTPIDALQPAHVDQALAVYRRQGLKGRPVSSKTCNRTLAALGSVWRWAEPRYGLRRRDCPTAGLRASEAGGRLRWLTPAEVEILDEETRAEGHADLELLVRLGLTTGHRRGPLVALEWSWIHYDRREIELPPHATKNGKPLVLHLADSVVELLEDRVRAVHHPYVLTPTGASQRPRFPRKRWEAVRSRCEARGVEPFVYHTLRHTWASLMAGRGMGLEEIAAGLGNTAAAAKIYAHFAGRNTAARAGRLLRDAGIR